jgi:hypothetical protein
MVRDEGVVSDEPIGKFLVEVLVPSDAVFLDGALQVPHEHSFWGFSGKSSSG